MHNVRSTFAAELHSALDAIGQAVIARQHLVVEVERGVRTANQTLKSDEDDSTVIPLDVAIDARSVYSSVTAETTTLTTENNLIVHAAALREQINAQTVHRFVRVDASRILADGLTKGQCLRDALLV